MKRAWSIATACLIAACGQSDSWQLKIVADEALNSEQTVLSKIDTLRLQFSRPGGFEATPGFALLDVDGDQQSELTFSVPVAGGDRFPRFAVPFPGAESTDLGVSVVGLKQSEVIAGGPSKAINFALESVGAVSLALNLRDDLLPLRLLSSNVTGRALPYPWLKAIEFEFSKAIAEDSQMFADNVQLIQHATGKAIWFNSPGILNTVEDVLGSTISRGFAVAALGPCVLEGGDYTLRIEPGLSAADGGPFTVPGSPAGTALESHFTIVEVSTKQPFCNECPSLTHRLWKDVCVACDGTNRCTERERQCTPVCTMDSECDAALYTGCHLASGSCQPIACDA